MFAPLKFRKGILKITFRPTLATRKVFSKNLT